MVSLHLASHLTRRIRLEQSGHSLQSTHVENGVPQSVSTCSSQWVQAARDGFEMLVVRLQLALETWRSCKRSRSPFTFIADNLKSGLMRASTGFLWLTRFNEYGDELE